MPGTLIVADNEDIKVGFFFKACQEVMTTYFNNESIDYIVYESPQIHHTSIAAFAKVRPAFILAAFSHGRSTALTKRSQPYVSIETNGNTMNGGVIYTFACSSGAQLAQELIDNHGVKAYIGYNKKIFIWNNEFLSSFVKCATDGLIGFYDGKSSKEIIGLIKETINIEIDRVYKIKPLVAADLRRNRDSLRLHGLEITMKELFSI